jgi:hypothetical protein
MSKNLLAKFLIMYMSLPDVIKPRVKELNKTKIVFDNGSMLIAGSTPDNFRSQSMSMLYFDNAAFIPSLDDFMDMFGPISEVCSMKILGFSAPKGFNTFYRFFSGWGMHKFSTLTLPIKDKSEAWIKETRNIIGEKSFRQEYLCEFV